MSKEDYKNEDTINTTFSDLKFIETEVNTSILDNSDYITAELPMSVYDLMPEHSYSVKDFYDKVKTKNINQKPYLLFIVQKKLIKSIKAIFDKLQKTDNWEDLDERLTLKHFLLKLFCVIKLISSTSVLSLKNLLDNVDYKMSFLKKNVNNILEFKSLLIEDIKDENVRLNKIACLKETLKITTDFYLKIKDDYQLLIKKRDKIRRTILKPRNSFILRIKYMGKNLKIIEQQCFYPSRVQMYKFLCLFDQKHLNSLNNVYKSLD
ncbi:hypothetical protein NBO_139g0001 [Nosema bombycis CQ1]|uniref:Uncharacterized protein n=1 Tax=Nosema bombycis (strain CQ1 / CVCC 102059) TaxID=578461 RepID=R0M588_NOSB1|nr:hypothetical protein NBO_139g0001 [Nosema bombycis CQ1]|eukprot:EOB13179.1 hypothetical protein NBO_139g0001 [Nosema bombycis CQ1]